MDTPELLWDSKYLMHLQHNKTTQIHTSITFTSSRQVVNVHLQAMMWTWENMNNQEPPATLHTSWRYIKYKPRYSMKYKYCSSIWSRGYKLWNFKIDTKSNIWTYTKQICIDFIWFAEVAFKLIASLVHHIDCAWYWLSEDDDLKRW